jgi:hypothetical protein
MVKTVPVHAMRANGVAEAWLHSFLTSALDESGQLHGPTHSGSGRKILHYP